MRIFNFCKKNAFTLVEVSICLLILSILVMLCMPMVVKQMKKADDYSYFMAFKTVEKLGSQIVAYGDPDLDNAAQLDIDRKFASAEGTNSYFIDKIVNSIDFLINKVGQKAIAKKYEAMAWTSYEYDLASLCNQTDPTFGGYYKVIKDITGSGAGGTQYFGLSDAKTHKLPSGLDVCTGLYQNITFTKSKFYNDSLCSPMTNEEFYTNLTTKSPQEYCDNILRSYCNSSNLSIKWEEKIPVNNDISGATGYMAYYECTLTVDDAISPSTPTTVDPHGASDNYTDSRSCDDAGYVDFTGNYPDCNCVGNIAYNDSKYCCTGTTAPGQGRAYFRKGNSCELGNVNRYNYKAQSACPENSTYSATTNDCICNDGYAMNAGGNCVQGAVLCQRGSRFNEAIGACVTNPPILKAVRFCELIDNNWNIARSNCGASMFSQDSSNGNAAYYEAVYNAASHDGIYLSVISNEGAFNNDAMPPNIIFSNGVKLWILSDKVASIPGLSFDPTIATPTINTCLLQGSHIETDCPANDTSGVRSYYCKNEKNCYTLRTSNSAGSALEDARNCCVSPDLTDIAHRYTGAGYLTKPIAYAIPGFTVFVDVNGNKGSGTLWEDVFPFYISSNGNVYPGYPLNAAKDSPSLYVGGNSSVLAADVYYYTVENGSRKKVNAYTSIPYARALCFSKSISPYTPYCMNLGNQYQGGPTSGQTVAQYIMSDSNPCSTHKCYVHVKNKIKFL